MSEEKEIKKGIVDSALKTTVGGADCSERKIYNFKCSCGNIVMRGNEQLPKFPCPKCMKKEWEFVGSDTIPLSMPVLEKND